MNTVRSQCCATAIAWLALGGSALHAQKPIPIRELAPAVGTDSGVIANVYMLHGRSDGAVLVNDMIRRRLVLLDSTMKHFTIVADTAGESRNKFGDGTGGLLPFPGDSTAFIDRVSQALIVVNKAGQFGRITTPPRVADIPYFAGNGSGGPGFDAQGRLYYRGGSVSPAAFLPATKPETLYVVVDSAPILRADFDARRIDTVAMMRIPRQKTKIIRSANSMSSYGVINPLPATDDWTYFADGTVAIVRGLDYHVDWILPNGARKSSPKMPFDWRRVTDDEKQRMIDSVHHFLDSLAAVRRARADSMAKATGRGGGDGGRGGGAGSGGASAGAARAAASPPGFSIAAPVPEVLKPDELPDYYPSIRAASQVRVDPDGNMWLLPTTSLQAKGGLLFDVVNRNGEIIERVQLPAGRNLQGFGPGGVVYMSVPAVMQAQFGYARVERARIIRP